MRRAALFVDDEQRVLDGLRRGLRDLRHDWDVRFALGGESALDSLEDDLTVVVSDMRMPGLDGVDVLAAARERAPGAARVILSGNSDRGASRRATGLAHRFLAKPCAASVLQALLPALAGCVEAAPEVPAFRVPPADAVRLAALRTLLDAGSGTDAVELLEQEPALVLTVLHAAASSSFTPGRPCLDAREAVERLGPAVVRELLDEPGLLDAGQGVEPAGGDGPATVRALAGLGPLLPPGALGPLLELWGLAPDLVRQVTSRTTVAAR